MAQVENFDQLLGVARATRSRVTPTPERGPDVHLELGNHVGQFYDGARRAARTTTGTNEFGRRGMPLAAPPAPLDIDLALNEQNEGYQSILGAITKAENTRRFR